ncbi:calcium/calmodulin-dependent protein kinase type II-like [Oscarella lobularis]|uniref:calcium/calmodulin-dependent protein kinase type II-like n=1 Tax=Oscarella lobularis TaxID=121494 RepID=UPI0033139852
MEAFVKAYDVDDVLGEGGFGTVYRCRAKMNGRAYAAKRIDPSKIKNAEDEEKVKAEIKICGMLCHQHVVRLRRCFSDDENSHMLVFELLESGELFDLIASCDTYSERDARHCIRQVLLALAYLETKRIVHRVRKDVGSR